MDETKATLIGFVAAFMLIGGLGFHSCNRTTQYDTERIKQRHETLRACLQAGRDPIHCQVATAP